MTREEICRAISEKLEPNRNIHEWTQNGYRQVSKLGFWTRDDTGRVECFNPFDSEDDSARLLEAMPYAQITRHVDFWMVRCSEDWVRDTFTTSDADRKTAIILAAMKWLQIEGELTPSPAGG